MPMGYHIESALIKRECYEIYKINPNTLVSSMHCISHLPGGFSALLTGKQCAHRDPLYREYDRMFHRLFFSFIFSFVFKIF